VAETNRRGVLFGGAATGIFVFGIVMAVLGTLFGLPEMRARLMIDLAQQGNVFLLLYVGILLATLVVGPVIDTIGNKVVLVASSVLVAAGMAGLAYAHSFGAAGFGRRGIEHLDECAGVRFVRREARANVELVGNFLWNWCVVHSFTGCGDRGTFRDSAAVTDLRGAGRSVRDAVSGDALSRGERAAEFFVA
jgi:MFS family permease